MVLNIITLISFIGSIFFLYGWNYLFASILMILWLIILLRNKLFFILWVMISLYSIKDFDEQYEKIKEMKKHGDLSNFIKNIF